MFLVMLQIISDIEQSKFPWKSFFLIVKHRWTNQVPMSRACLWHTRGVWSPYHVGLPGLCADTLVNTPPEVVLWLSSPCEHCGAWGTEQVMIKTEQKQQMSRASQMAVYLVQPEQQPRRSEWRRCYRPPSDTEPPMQTESRLAPAGGKNTFNFPSGF